MLTVEMGKRIRDLANMYGTAAYGVALMASAMGPERYRGCIEVIDYKPKYGKRDWKPASDYNRKRRDLSEHDGSIFESMRNFRFEWNGET